jgi:hypothetical protein
MQQLTPRRPTSNTAASQLVGQQLRHGVVAQWQQLATLQVCMRAEAFPSLHPLLSCPHFKWVERTFSS